MRIRPLLLLSLLLAACAVFASSEACRPECVRKAPMGEWGRTP